MVLGGDTVLATLGRKLFSPQTEFTAGATARKPSVLAQNRTHQIDELAGQFKRMIADFQQMRAIERPTETPAARRVRLENHYRTLDVQAKHILSNLDMQELSLAFEKQYFDETEFNRLCKEIYTAQHHDLAVWKNELTIVRCL